MREPAAHRLATRKARLARAYRRAKARYAAGLLIGANLDRWQVQMLARGRPGAAYRGVHGADRVTW